MKLQTQYISASSLILSGGMFIALGIVMIAQSDLFLTVLYYTTIIAFAVAGVFTAVNGVIHIGRRQADARVDFVIALLSFGLGVLVACFRELYLSFFPLIMGIYMFVNFLTKIITMVAYPDRRFREQMLLLFNAVIYLVLGVLLVTSPYERIPIVTQIIGVYCILYGATFFTDALREMLPERRDKTYRRRFRLTMPVMFAAFVPHRSLRAIQREVKREGGALAQITQETRGDKTPQLEVLIHTGTKGTNMIGHCDLVLDGTVYSYGCYDLSTIKLFGGYGEGIFFTVPDKLEYIRTTCTLLGKTLFGFGIHLDDKQYQRVRDALDNIRSDLVPWQPPAERDAERGPEFVKDHYADYASRLAMRTKVYYYKFRRGVFKTYFVLSTNCVLLADQVIGSAGTNILKLDGIITPGTYFDYLNREFQRKDSFVVSRTVYNLGGAQPTLNMVDAPDEQKEKPDRMVAG